MIAELATSDDRSVAVLAAAGGVPLQVRIEPQALNQRPEVLARIVLQAAASAGRLAGRRLHAELSAAVGPEATRTLERVGLARPDDGEQDDPGLDWGPR